MKFLDKLILFLFSTLILIFSVLSIFTIVGWIDSTTVFVIVTNALSNAKVCNVLIGINVVLILGAIKGIFFESNEKEENFRDGILLENNDVSIILTLEVSNNAVIKELSNNIQVKVKDAIKKSLDVDIKNLDIRVKNVIKPEENKAN